MVKMNKKIEVEIIKLFRFFNSFLKFTGFIIFKFDTSVGWWYINLICLTLNYSTAFGCTLRSEMWCLEMFDSYFSIKKFILFIIIQIISFTPILMLSIFTIFNAELIEIMLHASQIQSRLNRGMITLNLKIMKVFGLSIFLVMLMIPIITSYVTIALALPFSIIIDSVCMVYFEFWTAVPCAQFVNWITFLSYILHCVQNEVNISGKIYNGCNVKIKQFRHHIHKCESFRVRSMANIIVKVLSIAKELSAVYGITVLIYIVHYLARVIIQFYDVIDKDAQKFPMWTAVWSIIVRIMFILPVFICCEHLSYNINKTVVLIQEVVTLHQPSCLDCIFQSLTLRLKHQSTTTQICGFLKITYSSFLTIMTTALAFLLLQLQFSK